MENTDRHADLLAENFQLGIDGGGTKTVALVGSHKDGCLLIVGAGQGGPSNPRAIGFELAFANITQAVHMAFESAGMTPQKCSQAVLCLAGAGREEERLAIEAWARQSGLAVNARLVSEAEAVLAAAELDYPKYADIQLADAQPTNDECSHALEADAPTAEIALICGTGSLAWGRFVGSHTNARAGGWGYLLGDEGSGFWIGQRLLQMACHAADRRFADDRVLECVVKHLQLAHPSDLVHWCYGNEKGRERIAAIAPLAFELRDIMGVAEIISSGAAELAKMIIAVTQQLGCSKYSLAVGGSVLLQQQTYLQQILGCLSEVKLTPFRQVSVAEPVRGALYLAVQ